MITPSSTTATAVDITVSASGQESSKANAYTYFTPDVHLNLEPEADVTVGQPFPVPVRLLSRIGDGIDRISFTLNYDATLFAAQPAEGDTLAAKLGDAAKSSADPERCIARRMSGTTCCRGMSM